MSLRLHRDGAHVLCGVIDCGARVGRIHEPRHLVLLPGYRRDPDGVFRLTPRAIERMRHGTLPRATGRDVGRAWDPVPGVKAAHAPCCLPVKVKCFSCGQVQEASAVQLGIDPERRECRRPGEPLASHPVRPHPADGTEGWLPMFLPRA